MKEGGWVLRKEICASAITCGYAVVRPQLAKVPQQFRRVINECIGDDALVETKTIPLAPLDNLEQAL